LVLDFGRGRGYDSSTVCHSKNSLKDGSENLIVDSFKGRSEHNQGFGFAEVPFNSGDIGTSLVLRSCAKDVVEENLRKTTFDFFEIGCDFLDREFGIVD